MSIKYILFVALALPQFALSLQCPQVSCDYLMQANKKDDYCGRLSKDNKTWILNPCYDNTCSLQKTLEYVSDNAQSADAQSRPEKRKLECQIGMTLFLDYVINEKQYINWLNSSFYYNFTNGVRNCDVQVQNNCENIRSAQYYTQFENKTYNDQVIECKTEEDCQKDRYPSDGRYCQCNFMGQSYCRRLIGDNQFCGWLNYQCEAYDLPQFDVNKSLTLFVDAYTWHQMY